MKAIRHLPTRRHDVEKQALNWAYGCGRPDDWDDDVTDQLLRQNRLWNRLVEIERAHREEYRRITAEVPAVAELEAAISERERALEVAVSARNRARAAERKKKTAVAAEHDAAVKAISADLRDLRGKAKEARREAREALKPALVKLEQERHEAVTRARQDAAEGGLWWGNYNSVLASFDTARQRAMKTGGELRFARFDGAGRLTCQIQGGMTPDELFTGARSEVCIERDRPTPDGRPSRWSTLVITAYARGREMRRTLRIPIMIHRPFPAGSAIKGVSLIRRRLAPGAFEYRAIFQVVFEVGPPRPVGAGSAGVDFGWRRVAGGGIRVATLVDDAGTVEHAVVPADLVRRLELVGEIQSDLDTELNEFWSRVRSWDWIGAPPEMAEALAAFRDARKPHARHLVMILRTWPEDGAGWDLSQRLGSLDEAAQDLVRRHAELKAFLRRDRKEHLRLARTRRNALRARQDWQRNVVARWLRLYTRIVIDAMPLTLSGRIAMPDGTESPLPSVVRHQASLAAPGEMRAWLLDAGPRAGVLIVRHDGTSTWACHACGAVHKPADPSELMHRCRSCGTLWDQDVNAAHNLLKYGAVLAAE
jgi:hypothetical protein